MGFESLSLAPRRAVVATGLLLILTGAAATARAPVPISPGDAADLVAVEGRCPTFSWGRVDGAQAYEIVVYRLDARSEQAEPALRRRIAGAGLAWTPSLASCFDRGASYAWSVRAEGRGETTEWSAPNLFRVPEGPSREELEAALEVVRRHMAVRSVAERSGPAPESEVAPMVEGARAGAPAEAAAPEPAAVTLPGPVAFYAEQTEPGISSGVVGETTSIVGGRGVWGIGSNTIGANYGVYGQSAALLGAGVYGTNTGGGPAGLFDGTLKAQRSTGQAGGPVVEGVVVDGTGQAVKGTGAAGAWGYLGGAVSGVYGETGQGEGRAVHGKHTNGGYAGYFEGDLYVSGDVSVSDLSCQSCVTVSTIATGAVTEEKIADDSVRSEEIVDGTILPVDIAGGGLYRHKSSTYLAEGSGSVPGAGGIASVTATCADGNDLPLQGYCDSASLLIETISDRALYWNSSGVAAQWTCRYQSNETSTVSVTASILCITVD